MLWTQRQNWLSLLAPGEHAPYPRPGRLASSRGPQTAHCGSTERLICSVFLSPALTGHVLLSGAFRKLCGTLAFGYMKITGLCTPVFFLLRVFMLQKRVGFGQRAKTPWRRSVHSRVRVPTPTREYLRRLKVPHRTCQGSTLVCWVSLPSIASVRIHPN